ncbi:MAG: FAD-dependent thymidylate synthase [Christensenellaceae bacterium]|jgi:hypothetical protein|nr:FAD-dependent thymidylate synthase [Christensenellaceae bacterium]
MEVKIIAQTQFEDWVKDILNKKDGIFEISVPEQLAATSAHVCYMRGNVETILAEDLQKTRDRLKQIETSYHHSPFDHAHISLELDGISKQLAMILNDEQDYATSEKSARFTKMELPSEQQKLFDKWDKILKKEINGAYSDAPFVQNKIQKLSQENARYTSSYFNPSTTMIHTFSYRQLNILCGLMEKFIAQPPVKGIVYDNLKSEMQEFVGQIQNLGLYKPALAEATHGRRLKFFSPHKYEPMFSDVYQTNYYGSIAQLAQAHRHRTNQFGTYTGYFDGDVKTHNPRFFVPPVLRGDKSLTMEWNEDLLGQFKEGDIPQGTLLSINESGVLDDFINSKCRERLCSQAQQEISMQTFDTAQRYYDTLVETGHPRAYELKPVLKGAGCRSGIRECTTPCGFQEGINMTRMV